MLGYSNMDICFVEMLKFVVPLFKGVFFWFLGFKPRKNGESSVAPKVWDVMGY